jgi:hypothetical protein
VRSVLIVALGSPGRGDGVVDEDEDGLLWVELHALADHVDELSYSKVGWHLNEHNASDQCRQPARVNLSSEY